MKLFNNLKIKFSLQTRACMRLNKRFKGKDSWAIVTGCTNGIGESYAKILGENNFNLILIARNSEKLEKLKNTINSENPNVELRTVQFDFSDESLYKAENYDKLITEFSQLNISLLINNVGETTFGGEFFKYSTSKNKSLVNVNINSHLFITNLFVNSQIKYENNYDKTASDDLELKRKGIINISSYFGSRPIPGVSVYSASKTFLTNFSSSLFYELKSYNKFDVLCVSPLFVRTNMVRKWNSKFSEYFIIKPDDLVYSSFLRINNFKIHSYGHWKHTLQSLCLNLLPNFIFCKFSQDFYSKQYNKLFSRRNSLKKK